ncbi:MAG: hypothetical protein K2H52_03085 [Lachnospiraceae bacterium]|nr:hypothetical protein [Lachnospiraceae bacterium]
MDKNEEYHVKKEINKLIYNNIEEAFDRVINTSKGTYRTLIAYPLSVLENQYKVYSEVSVLTGFSSMELLLLINPLRQAVFWFIKEILKRNMEFRVEDAFYDFRNKEFGHPFCDFILNLHESYLDMQKLDINRGVARVEFNEIAENKYEIMFPTIKEAYDKEMLYYYGLDDALSSEREREKVIKVDKYLFSIFDAEKLTKYPDRLPGYIEKCDNMLNRTDAKLYRLCKTRVSVDVNKIAEKIESNVIEGKSELISVIALFYYISRLYMQKYMLNVINPLLDGKNMNYCDFHIDQIAKLSERVGICKKTLKRYIEYFSIDPNIEKGGFTEFPFIVQGVV